MSSIARGISIGDHALPNKAFLAPMAGITDRPFRTIAERHGAGLVVSEMIASSALAASQNDMVRRLNKREGRLPHVVQLAGCEAEWMQRGAEIACDAGADILDINFGCPAKRVTNGFAGSALMRVPDQALKLVETVVSATSLPVTVKMRLGWDDDCLNAAQIARDAVNAGVKMITVHGRTRQQFYKGTARWELVRAVVEAVNVPVVVNGDVVDLASAREALQQSGAAAVMLGRGAQGRPWVVGQIGAALADEQVPEAPAGDELIELIAVHYEDMMSEYGTHVGVRAARKHLDWYLEALGIVLDKPTRHGLLNAESPEAVLAMIPEIYSGNWREAA
ncbi:tRNA dihydrouridine synthase DusB [Paradevosia shaoguanensis]|nr:tRNA dihydrouridine synthase DusB [Paradevosia shaoguanensis]